MFLQRRDLFAAAPVVRVISGSLMISREFSDDSPEAHEIFSSVCYSFVVKVVLVFDERLFLHMQHWQTKYITTESRVHRYWDDIGVHGVTGWLRSFDCFRPFVPLLSCATFVSPFVLCDLFSQLNSALCSSILSERSVPCFFRMAQLKCTS